MTDIIASTYKLLDVMDESDLIKVIIVIRRCGKSVLLKQIMDEIRNNGVEDKNIIYSLMKFKM